MRYLLLAALLAATPATAEPLRLQLKWLPQTQFAGYYVAEAKGFYESAGLEVEIIPGGVDFDPAERLAAGKADISIEWFPAAMTAREGGLELVNVAQPYAKSGFALTCLKSKVHDALALKGAKIAIWGAGNEYPALALLSAVGLTPSDVTLVEQNGPASSFLKDDAADCVSTMSYNEAREVTGAGFVSSDLTIIDAPALGTSLLDDGLYVEAGRLADPSFAANVQAFVDASMQGWVWAQKNPEEAAKIVVDLANLDPTSLSEQTQMLEEVSALLGQTSAMDEASFAAASELLFQAGLISSMPDYTTIVPEIVGN
ncbi:MAG: ABC transporter substrate-binding protein [Pseudomonadota bacterium]